MKRRMLLLVAGLCAHAGLSGKVFAQYPDLYFSGDSGIGTIDLDTPSVQREIVPPIQVNTTTGIAVDFVGRDVYWISDTEYESTDHIRRANLDGSDAEIFITPAGQPADVEIDPFRRQLYYSERYTNTLNVIGLDGSAPRTLLSIVEPRGIDLDLVNGRLYWAEYAGNAIRSSRMDGTDVRDVVVSGVTRPFDVTVDPLRNRLYWVELGPNSYNSEGRIWMATLDGGNPTLIAHHQYQPTDLVIDAENKLIYWNLFNGLMRADLDGGNATLVVGSNLAFKNIALDVSPLVPEPGSSAVLAASLLGLAFRPARRGVRL